VILLGILTWEQAERIHGPLLHMREAAGYIHLGAKTVHELIEQDKLKGFYLQAGRDIQKSHRRMRYVFLKTKLDEFNDRYKNVTVIADELHMPASTLRLYVENGYLESVPRVGRFFDRYVVKEKVLQFRQQANKSREQKRASGHGGSKFHFLSEELQELINAYISHRKRKLPIKYHGQRFRSGFSNDDRAEAVKNELSRVFYRIICGRCNITNFSERDPNLKRDYRILSPDEAEMYNPEIFRLYDFNYNDLEFVQQRLSPISFFQKCEMIRPFLFWFLKQEELKPEHNMYTSPEGYQGFKGIEHRILMAIDEMPTEQPAPEQPRENKVFLSRKWVVEIYAEILKSRSQNTLKYATEFMVGCFLGLRPPMEWSRLRIEYFMLDKDGFLRVDQNGWGVLKFPGSESKGGYGPSHSTLGTLVVPRLVKLINRYLGQLYGQYPEGRGKGFMFRPAAYLLEQRYKSRSMVNWIYQYVREFDYLDEEIGQIIPYDTRHTLNELIDTAILSDRKLDRHQKRAAEVQMRQNIDLERGNRRYGNVGDVHYRKEISKDTFFQVIDGALNFPWDLDELRIWEEEKGYREREIISPDPLPKPVQPVSELFSEEEQKRLKEAHVELKVILKKNPKGWTAEARFQRIKELKNTISVFERRMNA
jgi:hypothetical protein